MKEIKTQIVSYRITPTEWKNFYRKTRDVGLKIGDLARLCLLTYGEQELKAYKKRQVEEARKLVEEYDKEQA